MVLLGEVWFFLLVDGLLNMRWDDTVQIYQRKKRLFVCGCGELWKAESNSRAKCIKKSATFYLCFRLSPCPPLDLRDTQKLQKHFWRSAFNACSGSTFHGQFPLLKRCCFNGASVDDGNWNVIADSASNFSFWGACASNGRVTDDVRYPAIFLVYISKFLLQHPPHLGRLGALFSTLIQRLMALPWFSSGQSERLITHWPFKRLTRTFCSQKDSRLVWSRLLFYFRSPVLHCRLVFHSVVVIGSPCLNVTCFVLARVDLLYSTESLLFRPMVGLESAICFSKSGNEYDPLCTDRASNFPPHGNLTHFLATFKDLYLLSGFVKWMNRTKFVGVNFFSTFHSLYFSAGPV